MNDNENPQKKFQRQLVLIETVREAQEKCQHTLIPGSQFIVCSECGALWIKS